MSEYKCAVCREVFDTGWTDEKALAELDEKFPWATVDDCELVCDDRYNKMGFGDSQKQIAASDSGDER
jgi:hypothetical protein